MYFHFDWIIQQGTASTPVFKDGILQLLASRKLEEHTLDDIHLKF